MRVPEIATSRMPVLPGEDLGFETPSRADGLSCAADRSELRIELLALAFVSVPCATVLGLLSEIRLLDWNSADHDYDELLGSPTLSITGVGRDDVSGATASLVFVNAGPASNDRLKPSVGSPRASRPGGPLSFSSMTKGDAP